MKKMNKRGKRILVMVLVFAILCTSLPCTPTIPVHAAQTGKNGTWYEVSSRINASWDRHITGQIMITNVSSQTRQDWQIAFPWQAQISSMWNGRYEETDDGYLITPLEYNTELAPKASVSVGFTAEGEDSELSRLTEDGFFQEAGVSITDAEERENMTPVPSVDVKVGSTEEATVSPSVEPTASPTVEPTASPTVEPTVSPTVEPTASLAPEPTANPTASPTAEMVISPSLEPTPAATIAPTKEMVRAVLSMAPTAILTIEPSASPTIEPTASPTVGPTVSPTVEPTVAPSEEEPTVEPAEDLYIYTDTTIREDIVCGSLILMGGSLECNGHRITVQKDYYQNGNRCSLSASELKVAGSIRIASGELSASADSHIQAGGDFLCENAENISLSDSQMNIRGNMGLKKTNDFYINNNSVVTVTENLTVSQGYIKLYGNAKAEVHGDVLVEGSGALCSGERETKVELLVQGDMVIDSSAKTEFLNGKIRLQGDLIQKETALPKSLWIGNNSKLVLEGQEQQKLDIAYPENVWLGGLDLRNSREVEVPDELHGYTIYGYEKMVRKSCLDLYLSRFDPNHDETISMDKVILHINGGSVSGHALTVNGNLEIIEKNSFYVDNNSVVTVTGNLTVSQGCFKLYGNGKTGVHGDVRAEGSGYLCSDERSSKVELLVHGDLVTSSSTKTEFLSGKIKLQGDLIQKETASPKSLWIGNNSKLILEGQEQQKLDIAYPENVWLGELDLWKSSMVEVPDEIHGYTIYGYEKMVRKSCLDLYLSSFDPIRDETIGMDKVILHTNGGSVSGHALTVNGNLEIIEKNSFYVDNNSVVTVTGNLTVSQGCFKLYGNARAEIHGDVRAEGSGSLCSDERSPEVKLLVHGDMLIDSTAKTEFLDGEITLCEDIKQIENEQGSAPYAGFQRCQSYRGGEDCL